MNTFGYKLKKLRKEKGFTQQALAQEIKQAQSTISYWEQDKKEPIVSALKKLCITLDVSADYLLGLKDEY